MTVSKSMSDEECTAPFTSFRASCASYRGVKNLSQNKDFGRDAHLKQLDQGRFSVLSRLGEPFSSSKLILG